MCNDSLSRNILIPTQQFQFLCRCQMSYVKTSPKLTSESYSQLATFITGFDATNLWMIFYIRVIAIFFLIGSHVTIDNFRILAMRHHGKIQLLGCTKYTLQRFILIHQHIASTRTHKEFDARYTVLIQFFKQANIVIGSSKEEAVIDMTFPGTQLKLIFQCFQGRCLRNRVRHFEIRSYTSVSSRPAFAFYISLAGQSRLSEVDVVIDDTRQNKTPRGLDNLVVGTTGSIAFIYLGDSFTIDNEVSPERAPLIDDRAILNEYFHVDLYLNTIRPKHYGLGIPTGCSFFPSGMVGLAKSLAVGAGTASGFIC